MARRNAEQAGFTLIELMVVVAVVGLLSAIAASKFDNIRTRARQSEVKVQLRSLYVAEQAYYANNNTYSNDMGALGYNPSRGNRYAYYIDLPATSMQARTGPATPLSSGNDAIGVDTFAFPQLSTVPTEFSTDGALTFAANAGGLVIPTGSTAYFKAGANGAFLARAFGWISSNKTTTYDAWFISSSGASVTSPCGASNGARVSAGAPGNTYDQSQCF
jgi:type IV pilus assembly protein PilA